MIESCIDSEPTAACPQCERPMISFRKPNDMNGMPWPPISTG